MKNSKLLIGVLAVFIGAILLLNNKVSKNSSSKQTNTYAVSNTNSISSSAIGDTATDFQVSIRLRSLKRPTSSTNGEKLSIKTGNLPAMKITKRN